MEANESSAVPEDEAALRSMLRDWFLRSSTPERPLLLGFEYECLRVRRDDAQAAPSRGSEGPDALVRALGRRFLRAGVEAEEFVEAGDLALLRLGAQNFSVEPGGQIEISLAPYEDPLQVAQEIDRFVQGIDEELAASPYAAVFLGHQPMTMPADIPLRAKPRYAIMNRRFAERGKLGIHMMRATAGMQVTLDTRSEEDCASMLRAALVSAPIVTALFANSPFVGGKPSGVLSFREIAWWDTDPSRCGVPPACLDEDAGIEAYVDWALDAEPWFVRRAGELCEVRGFKRFRDLLGTQWHPSLDDFSLHATTLFPSARLRGGVELRSADCVSAGLARSFCAFQAGLFYDDASRKRAANLHAVRDLEGLRALHACASRDGLAGRCGDFVVRERAEELLDASRAGLRRQIEQKRFGPEVLDLLAPLAELVEAGRSPAHELLERYEKDGSVRAAIAGAGAA